MKTNVGNIDKVLRIIAGLAIIVYGVYAQSWLGLIAIIPLGTAIIGWCPLYLLLGLNTTCDKDNCTKE
jgi:putative effector of murein hydrolase LrgA (UPF0299 family)